MSLTTALAAYLLPSAAKFLFKHFLGTSGEFVGDAVADYGKDTIKDELQRRKAGRHLEQLADNIVGKLKNSVEHSDSSVNYELVVKRLGMTVNGHVSSKLVLGADLKPEKLADQLRKIAKTLPRPLPSKEEAFFQSSIAEISRYLVETAAALPRFAAATAERSIEMLADLTSGVEQILEKVHRIETQTSALGGNERTLRYEKDYREAVLRNCDWVELFGVDLPSEYKRNQLSDAFVSLELEADEPLNDDAGDTGGTSACTVGNMRRCEVVLDSLRPGNGLLLIRGVAGGGKTTLLRWIAINAAPFTEEAESRRTRIDLKLQDNAETGELEPSFLSETEVSARNNLWRNRVPFLILLRHCKDGQLPTPDSFPLTVAKEVGNPPADWVRSILEDGRGIVLLDGVDEVPVFNRDELYKRLRGLIQAYHPDNYVVVTTRPEAVEDNWLQPLGFREASVSPLSREEVHRFIDRWHSAFAKTLRTYGNSIDNLPQVAVQLKKDIRDEPAVAMLAANPLLCGMICALNHYRTGKLPQTLPALCKSLLDMLLYRRDEEQNLDVGTIVPEYHRLSHNQKTAILKHLAVFFIEERKSVFDTDSLVRQVESQLKMFPKMRYTRAGKVLRGFIERSGILREVKPTSPGQSAQIEFLHNTFKEYLAGEYFATADRVNRLLENMNDESWRRVALFAVGTDQEPTFAK